MNERLLIVEDEATLGETLKQVPSRKGRRVDGMSNAESAIVVCEGGSYNLIGAGDYP
ncbi:MAG: hypothetical protein ABSA46_06720 [Thermodesulfovibrionales bacterium]|jgi:DNA-binding response OmpR family regulator